MATLFDRLTGDIAIHGFEALLVEYIRGIRTKEAISGFYNFDATEEAQFFALIDEIDSKSDSAAKLVYLREIGATNTLAELEIDYLTGADWAARLGLV